MTEKEYRITLTPADIGWVITGPTGQTDNIAGGEIDEMLDMGEDPTDPLRVVALFGSWVCVYPDDELLQGVFYEGAEVDESRPNGYFLYLRYGGDDD